MSALEAVEECDYPEFGFPLPLETSPIFEPHMPQEALDRWGFVIVACCTTSHRDVAERLRKSCYEFGIYRTIRSEIRRHMRKLIKEDAVACPFLTLVDANACRAAIQHPSDACRARDLLAQS